MAAVPVWAFHGEKDPTVPVHFSRDLTAAVTQAGGSAKYTEYPGVGHDSWSKAYQETGLWQWLFSQRKSVDANQH
jgi:predicted esterase